MELLQNIVTVISIISAIFAIWFNYKKNIGETKKEGRSELIEVINTLTAENKRLVGENTRLTERINKLELELDESEKNTEKWETKFKELRDLVGLK